MEKESREGRSHSTSRSNKREDDHQLKRYQVSLILKVSVQQLQLDENFRVVVFPDWCNEFGLHAQPDYKEHRKRTISSVAYCRKELAKQNLSKSYMTLQLSNVIFEFQEPAGAYELDVINAEKQSMKLTKEGIILNVADKVTHTEITP